MADRAVRFDAGPGGRVRVPELLPEVAADRSLEQVVNVATLPGIVEASFAMPDVHWGYGFPIGGVAATDVDAGGVVSPGGVGFDISCGVRLLLSPLDRDELAPKLAALMDELDRVVPRGHGTGCGVGSRRRRRTGPDPHRRCGVRGASRVTARTGTWTAARTAACSLAPTRDAVSDRALLRGLHQVGSLGSGNHFLEVQVVDQVLDAGVAERVRAARRAGVRDDPLRVTGAGPPGLHRPRPAHGVGDGPLRHPGPGPPAGLRAGPLP